MLIKRQEILVSAYACSPYQGSEPGVGWGIVYELSKYHNLTVFVEEEKFKLDIEKYINENGPIKNTTFIFVMKKRNRFLRKLYPPSYYWYYRRWHLKVYNIAKKMCQFKKFDLAYQLTMVGFREPGYLWRLNIPFMWGPIGGMGYFDFRLLRYINFKSRLFYIFYNLYNFIDSRIRSRSKKAASKCNQSGHVMLISATNENHNLIKKYWHSESVVLPEVGFSDESFNVEKRSISNVLNIYWSGALIPRKALNILIESLVMLPPDLDWCLHVVGDGELMKTWSDLARKYFLSDKIIFHGWLTRVEALSILRQCDLTVITSLRDLSSMVSIESIAHGVPVVTLDHCGFSDIVDENCGIKINPYSHSLYSDIANVIASLGRDRGLLETLSIGALRRAKSYTWASKVEILNSVIGSKSHI